MYITVPKVQNEDPFKIVLKLLENGSKQYSLLDRWKLVRLLRVLFDYVPTH